ncbi:MAG: M23 family metallopeptidase [Acidobacteria bacterium]|nr:M23 family metallopeptidase [Acidobacteriota bacterium]
MEKKFYTFLIFPGAHGKLRSVRLPFYAVHIVLAFSVVGLLSAVALSSSYARMLLKVANYNSVRSEREALRVQYRALENTVTQTNAKLGSLQSLASEVALSYGFGVPRRPSLPQSVVAMALEGNSGLESGFSASIYAFRLMKAAASGSRENSVIQSLIHNPPLDSNTMPSIWPVRGHVTGGFGERMDPLNGEEGAFHSGMDIAAPAGTPVEAPADGIVFSSGPDSGYGNAVLIDHGFGITTKYGHLSRVDVVIGQEVKRGQIIGAVGETGRTTGPHLHYEVHIHETPVNPAKYLRG